MYGPLWLILRPFLGWKEAIYRPKWHLPFPSQPPAQKDISMWNEGLRDTSRLEVQSSHCLHGWAKC